MCMHASIQIGTYMKYIRVLLIATLTISCSAQSTQDRIDALDTLVQATFDQQTPGGVVLVGHQDDILFHAAIGTDGSQDTKLTTDSIFRIASVTKQFTAVAVLQLQEQGKLNLDDDITTYIPEFETYGNRITIQMLLNHTSGIRSFTSMPSFNTQLETTDVSPNELMEFFNHQELEFEPGTQRAYSNSGYALLGLIIERISKMTYAQYMDKNIFTPIGMERSYAGGEYNGTTGFAKGHYISETGYPPATRTSLTWPYAAGCIETTTSDLHLWTRALFAGKLISLKSLAAAHTVTTLPSGAQINYGYGWDLMHVQGIPTVEHGGAIAGFASTVLYLPSEEVFVAVLSNAAWNGTEELAARLAAIAIGKPYQEIQSIELAIDKMKELVGIYTNESGAEREILIRDGRLYSQRTGGMGLFLVPIGPNEFMMEGQLIKITFVKDLTGEFNLLLFSSRSEDSVWKRIQVPSP